MLKKIFLFSYARWKLFLLSKNRKNTSVQRTFKYIQKTGCAAYSQERITLEDLSYLNTLEHHYIKLYEEIFFVKKKFLSESNKINQNFLELGSYMSVGSHIALDFDFNIYCSDIHKLEPNSQFINWLQSNNITYIPIDLTKLRKKYFLPRYDCIVFQETLEHIPYNPLKIMQTIGKMLSKNGYLIFSVPNLYSLKNFLNILRCDHPYLKIQEFVDIGSTTEQYGVHWIEFNRNLIFKIIECSDLQIIRYEKSNLNYGNYYKYLIKKFISIIFPTIFDQHRFILKNAVKKK
jgi:SAM-dependent methyltransferase